MVDAPVPGGGRRGHLRLLRAPAIPAGAVRRPAGVPDRRPRGGHRRRRADPRWSGGTSHPAALSPPHVRADPHCSAERRHARLDRPHRELLGGAGVDRRLGLAVRSRDADSAGLSQRPHPVAPARDDPLVRLAHGLVGRRLDAAAARPRRGRVGLCAVVRLRRRDLSARRTVPRTVQTGEHPRRLPRPVGIAGAPAGAGARSLRSASEPPV